MIRSSGNYRKWRTMLAKYPIWSMNREVQKKGVMMSENKHETVLAICYDFDKTLTPDDMQAQGYIQSVGADVSAFWAASNGMAKEKEMDQNLAYMLEMKNEAEGHIVFTRQKLKEYGEKIRLFPGVKDWFERTRRYGEKYGVKVEHYIISSGLKEMIEGTALAKAGAFERVYASSFHYNDRGVAIWPAQVVNYTNKTQFLFRISKGCLDINDDRVNDYFPSEKIRVPFRNMVYIGDSDTDIPCMKLVNQNGGYSIGVFNPAGGALAKDKVYKMLRERRIAYFCPADYSRKKPLDELLKNIIRLTAVRSKVESVNLQCRDEACQNKRDIELANVVEGLATVVKNANIDWNGLMGNPDLLLKAIGTPNDLPNGHFHQAIYNQIGTLTDVLRSDERTSTGTAPSV